MTATERQIYDMFETYPEARRFRKKDAKDRVRIQVGQADRVQEGLIRAGRYFEAMKQILRDHDIPETFVYLPIVESGFNTRAESYLGAAGMWQFMRSTGKQYNLNINAYLDERRDPLLATAAAAKLLSHNYKSIQSWPLAITAYNHGLQGMKNAARAAGTSEIDVIIAEYDGPRFGFASRNFYPEFLAAIDVGLRYTEYFGELELVPPMTLARIPLTHYVSAATLEKHTPLTAAEIKELNPALHSSVFTAGSFLPRHYELNVPEEHAEAFKTAYAAIPSNLKLQAVTVRHTVKKGETLSTIAARHNTTSATLARLNNISNPSRIRIGQVIHIPSSSAAATQIASTSSTAATASSTAPTSAASTSSPSSATSAASTRTHRVTKGQTLSVIAQRYGTTVNAIARLNNITNTSNIREGQMLTIPAASGGGAQHIAAAADTATMHRVQKGQTLTSIARQYNTTVQALSSLNNIHNPRTIRPGQLLKIPQG
jgi:membrane-bound lytic murein transglycosylase D